MKASILVLSILGLSLAGCSRTYMKESVIEKEQPVAVAPSKEVIIQPQREIIIEKPVAITRNCLMGSSTFSHGSLSCQTGIQYRCNDGRWESQGSLC